ncbi:hypothetical protein H6H87_002247 [Salmonella enterica]|uniref:hypothetical protein n=1 Tax=Hafnia paralvei TaxID=546367 RepID=UPI000DF40F44|nr:hypothetical protein [Hafnia paralvei]EEO8811262.1 hypothetical protein [Salmonella enterica]EFR1952534.1 hypothetical protein [Salmonella enterica]EGA9482702.1 hypothetical protein [Salmonella enterica]EGH1266486.1 hypothetical protein [Salmonella enterica]EHW0602526.1 hypothetical protein [Salmonella enterica]
MSESLIVFCQEWAVTVALTGYLAPVYPRHVMPVHGLAQLTRILQAYPRMPVVLGLYPHEHVVNLYRLQPLLAGRTVLFVGRCFYWTDYNLPEWLALKRYGFCTWDAMQDPLSRRMELRRFSHLCVYEKDEEDDSVGKPLSLSPAFPHMTERLVLERANRWLYRELPANGLTGNEIQVLSLMTEGRKGNMPIRTRSLHKNNGLYKLGMTKHLIALYRGVKVRPELQSRLTLQIEGNEESDTDEIQDTLLFRQEVGR